MKRLLLAVAAAGLLTISTGSETRTAEAGWRNRAYRNYYRGYSGYRYGGPRYYGYRSYRPYYGDYYYSPRPYYRYQPYGYGYYGRGSGFYIGRRGFSVWY